MYVLITFAVLMMGLLVLAVYYSLKTPPLAISNRALGFRWIAALLLTLGVLFLPIYTQFPDTPVPRLHFPFYLILASTRYLLPLLAWVLASSLLSFGLAGLQALPVAPSRWRAVVSLALGAVLLVGSFYDLYGHFLWDQTTDGAYVALLIVPVIVAFLAGVIFTRPLEGSKKWYGFGYGVLLIAVLFTAFSISLRVDHQQLTEARAGQVSQAIERYYARQGHYPATLSKLSPWTRLSLPHPVIMIGQDWCYQSGEGYYRLGYVDRDHWSSPYLYIRTYQQAGAVPDSPALCAEEIRAQIARCSICSVVGE
jgi:hypothetical protein